MAQLGQKAKCTWAKESGTGWKPIQGKPDELRGELVKASVVVYKGSIPNDDLAEKLKSLVRNQLSKHQYLREIEFVEGLPKTPSGKIQRILLRQEKTL